MGLPRLWLWQFPGSSRLLRFSQTWLGVPTLLLNLSVPTRRVGFQPQQVSWDAYVLPLILYFLSSSISEIKGLFISFVVKW